MERLEDRTVRCCFIAKNKENGKLHKGIRNHVGFSNIGDLKKSITYLWRNNEIQKPHDMFDFYKVDSENMTFEKVEK